MAIKSEESKRFEAYKALAFDEAKNNCAYFIEEFVYIENKGSNTPVIKFDLWPEQKKSLKDMLSLRWLIFLKARQLGCTWLVLAYALWLMLRPSKRIIALSKTEIDANQLVQRVEFMLRYLPDWFIRQSSVPIKDVMTWDSTATKVWIRHPNGEDSLLMSMPAAQNSGASLTADLVIFDEWGLMEWAAQIYRAAFPTINRPGDKPENGQVFGLSTMRLGSFFHKMVLGAMTGANDYKLVFWSWRTDPSRDDSWYERTERNYEGNMSSDYPATIEEALSAAEGCFFQEIRVDIHHKPNPQTIPARWHRYASIDYGLDGLAVLWYAVDDDGRAQIYRELFQTDATISDAAGLILSANQGDRLEAFFAPPDLWNRRQDTGKSFARTFLENGIVLLKTDNRREQGWVAVKEWLKPRKIRHPQTNEEMMVSNLTIDKDVCPNIWRCLTTIQKAKNTPNDVADKPHELTHLPDSLRAFAAGWLLPLDGNAIVGYEEEEETGYDSFIDYGK